ncbi:MAG: winged helix-turn-helix domain-containing protein [Candidatus Bathyarchaeia archaeon]
MSIENILSSRVRIKILKILMSMGELNISELARRLNINYSTARQHLQILEDAGMIKQKTFGKIRLYRLNEQSPRVRALQNLIEVWEHQNK